MGDNRFFIWGRNHFVNLKHNSNIRRTQSVEFKCPERRSKDRKVEFLSLLVSTLYPKRRGLQQLWGLTGTDFQNSCVWEVCCAKTQHKVEYMKPQWSLGYICFGCNQGLTCFCSSESFKISRATFSTEISIHTVFPYFLVNVLLTTFPFLIPSAMPLYRFILSISGL